MPNALDANAVIPSWDLADLYPLGPQDPRLSADLENGPVEAVAFAKRYRGFWEQPNLAGPQVLAAIEAFQRLREFLDRPLIYAMLHHAALTTDAERGKLLSKARESHSRSSRELIFFELEWIKLSPERAEPIIQLPEVQPYAHWLRMNRLFRDHTISEPEEKIVERKQLTGRSAFRRFFDETVSSLRFPLPNGQKVSLQTALSLLYDPDRDLRQGAAESISQTLATREKDLGYMLNTLVLDHQDDCEMRGYATPDAPRNLSNQVDGSLVQMVMEEIEARHDIVARYYSVKRGILGLKELKDWDRYAPMPGDAGTMNWDQARKLVGDSYRAFHPEAGRIVSLFFEKNWIDADPRDGKRSGAFCSSGVASIHPYILMSYTGRLRDVTTLAHELGHGIHQYLARERGHLQADAPLVLAETASVFGEMLVYERIFAGDINAKERRLLLASRIEDSIATIFRQIVLTRFEHQVHQLRREEGELSPKTLGQIWMETNQAMFGDSLVLTQGYSHWWSYIGHFIHSPFYCYAYSFGELLVLALYAKYREEGDRFAEKYMAFLAAGGSKAPATLLAELGIDWSRPDFWRKGLGFLDEMVKTMENDR